MKTAFLIAGDARHTRALKALGYEIATPEDCGVVPSDDEPTRVLKCVMRLSECELLVQGATLLDNNIELPDLALMLGLDVKIMDTLPAIVPAPAPAPATTATKTAPKPVTGSVPPPAKG